MDYDQALDELNDARGLWPDMRLGLGQAMLAVMELDAGLVPAAYRNAERVPDRVFLMNRICGDVWYSSVAYHDSLTRCALAFIETTQATLTRPIFGDDHPIWQLDSEKTAFRPAPRQHPAAQPSLL